MLKKIFCDFVNRVVGLRHRISFPICISVDGLAKISSHLSCAVQSSSVRSGKLHNRWGSLYGEGEPATMTSDLEVVQNHTRSQWVRLVNNRGESELPSFMKVNGESDSNL